MKLLKFSDFVNSLNEARVYEHPDSTYVFNPTNHSKVPSDILDLTFNKVNDMEDDHRMFFVRGSSRVTEIDHNKAIHALKGKNSTLLKDNEGHNVYLIVDGIATTILTERKKSNETTTNVKEAMVVCFYYSDINEIPNLHNAEDVIESLQKVIVPKESLDPKTIKELESYLQNLAIDKLSVKNLIDFWSVGYHLRSLLDNKSHTILRTGLFDDIRRLGSKLTGFSPDKWNPGDIYVADSTALNSIYTYLKDIEKNIQPDSIGKLNALFSHELQASNQKGFAEGSILAVSLKQEKAQAGKAKEFLKSLTKDQTEYNVTDEEYDSSDSDIESKIEILRKKISTSCASSSITINLSQDTGYKNSDPVALRKKYASLKITAKLLENPQDIDDNILKSAAYAMSLTGVNPTFFKFSGSSSGSAKVDKFPAGDMIYLMDNGLGHKGSILDIIDRNTSSEIIFKFRIMKGEEEKSVVLKCRPNGSRQSTLEIEKLK
jgi:hypothetical protein